MWLQPGWSVPHGLGHLIRQCRSCSRYVFPHGNSRRLHKPPRLDKPPGDGVGKADPAPDETDKQGGFPGKTGMNTAEQISGDGAVEAVRDYPEPRMSTGWLAGLGWLRQRLRWEIKTLTGYCSA